MESRMSYAARAVMFITLIHFAFVWASAPVESHSTCGAGNEKCSAVHEPKVVESAVDEVLENLHRIKENSAETVVREGRMPDLGEEKRIPGKHHDSFGNVWNSAYQQWVSGEDKASPTVKGLSPAAKKAIEEVQRRGANTGQLNDATHSKYVEDAMAENEAVLLEEALSRVSAGSIKDSAEELYPTLPQDLDLIENLCHSGDNGNHLESIGGVGILINLTQSALPQGLKVFSVKALATCAQNNPIVFNRAVSDGAIGSLLRLADGTEDSAMRASVLRALLSLSEAMVAEAAFMEDQQRLLGMVQQSVAIGIDGKDDKRSVLRGLALLESLLKRNHSVWLSPVQESGILQWCSSAVSHEDSDIRESAATLIKAVETN